LEKKITSFEGCEREIEISVTNVELEPYFEKEYIKVQPHIELKGFRKGRVPIRIIKQYFGKKIEKEALEEVTSEFFNKIIQDDKLRVIGQPQLKNVDRTSEGATFKVVFEVIPEFELTDYRSLQIDEPVHSVSDEEIDEQVNKFLIGEGSFEDAESVENENYLVQIRLYELDEQTETILLDKEPQETFLLLSEKNILPELRKQLIGCRIDDRFNFKSHENNPENPNKMYSVVVLKIQKVIPAEFTNELTEKITKGKCLTTEEFRQEIGFDMQEQWNQKSRQEMENQIVDQLVDAHNFELPESLVWNTIEIMLNNFKKKYEKTELANAITSENMADSIRPMAERTVKWELIRHQIIEKEKLEVEDHDIDELIEIQAQKTGADPTVVRREILKNENITSNILYKKVMDLIFDFATTNEVNFEEYEHNQHHDHDYEHDHDHDQDHEHFDDIDDLHHEHKSNIILP
jgi:trigger factor